jgi:hypothetical protein
MANVRSEERDGSGLGNFEKRRDANRSSAFGEKGGDGVGGRAEIIARASAWKTEAGAEAGVRTTSKRGGRRWGEK